MNRNEFSVLRAIDKTPNASYQFIAIQCAIPLDTVLSICDSLTREKLILNVKITSFGKKKLSLYRAKNAIIMAAGMASRFVPLSFEKPKGLLKVKGEVLIERQINQLVEIGIKNIILVLGYKKEMFYYLKEKYPFIKFIVNPCYDTKNNIESLYLVRKYLGNSYICSSDDYFTINPFDEYVYESYYAGHYAKEKTDEFYMELDSNYYIKKIYIGGSDANIMFGHAYFDKMFAKEFVKLMKKHHNIGDYDRYLWDVMLMNNLKELPHMYGKLYPYGIINEFDTLEDLRKFDSKFINYTGSEIMKNICKLLKCKEADITDLSIVKKDNNRKSFKFKAKNKYYIYHVLDKTVTPLLEHKDKII